MEAFTKQIGLCSKEGGTLFGTEPITEPFTEPFITQGGHVPVVL